MLIPSEVRRRSPRILFFSCWVLSSCLGICLLAVTYLANAAHSWYEVLLGGKPLPALTQFLLSIHLPLGANVFAVALVLMATHAFLVHWFTSRAQDESRAVWTWLLMASLTIAALLFYLFASLIALLLPLVPICCGMVHSPDDDWWKTVRIVSFLGAMLYALVLAIITWRGGTRARNQPEAGRKSEAEAGAIPRGKDIPGNLP